MLHVKPNFHQTVSSITLDIALALTHNNSLRQVKIFNYLRELKTAKEIYENQLREISQLSKQEFAQKIYAPEKITEDLSQENQASLQKWMDYFPHAFFHQPNLFIEMQSIAERQKNIQWITSLATFFVDHRHLFQGMYQAQTIFSQFLRMLSDASENREQLPIVIALLNATESPAFKFPNLTVILHFGLDTKNKQLISTILKSKQALFLEDFTLQEMYPRLEGELKSTLEDLWRKTGCVEKFSEYSQGSHLTSKR